MLHVKLTTSSIVICEEIFFGDEHLNYRFPAAFVCWPLSVTVRSLIYQTSMSDVCHLGDLGDPVPWRILSR